MESESVLKPTGPKKYQLIAVNWSESFPLKELVRKIGHKPMITSGRELVFEYPGGRYLFVYSFGVATFFNMTSLQRDRVIRALEASGAVPLSRQNEDCYTIEIRPPGKDGSLETVGYESVVWSELEFKKLRMVAKVLSESVALEYSETLANEILQKTHLYTLDLQLRGRVPYRTKRLVKYIGFAMRTKEHVMASFYIIDKPDETWDDPALEDLYLSLKDMFDIDIRFRALEQKLRAIQDAVEIIVELVRSRRDMILEVLIVLLISVELVIWLMERAG